MQFRTSTICLTAFLLCFHALHAQETEWEQLHGPYGDFLYRFFGVLVDGQNGDMYFGRPDGVLIYRQEKQKWEFSLIGRAPVHALCSTADKDLIAGTVSGIQRRDAGNQDWHRPAETEGFSVWSLACSPATGRLFAGCEEGALLVSTDGGNNWDYNFIDIDVACTITCLTFDDSGNLYAGTEGQGVWLSTDEGVAWTRVGEGILDSTVHCILFDDFEQMMYVGGSTTVGSTRDRGMNWSSSLLPVAEDNYRIKLCRALDGRVLAGTDKGMFVSTDRGGSWTRSMMETPDSLIVQLFWNPVSGTYCVATDAGLFRSETGRAPWELFGPPSELINTIHCTTDGLIVAGLFGSVAVSSDGGDTWKQAGPGSVYGLASDTQNHLLYAGARSGLFVSADRGSTWEKRVNGLGSTDVQSLCLLPDGVLLAASAWRNNAGGVYASSDQGMHWEARNSGIDDRNCYWIERDPADGTLYVASVTGSVYRSTDDGQTWRKGPISPGIYPALAVDFNGRVLAGTGQSGIHLSTDRGETWSRISKGILDYTAVNWIETNGAGEIFAGCGMEGVFRTSDDGASWHRMNEGLGDSVVMCLAIDEEQHLYAGTLYGGVYRTVHPTTVRVRSDPMPTAMEIHAFPNPFSDDALISVQSSNAAEALTLKLHDANGRVVADLTQSVRACPVVRVTRSILPSAGVYFIRLTTQDQILTRTLLCIE